MKNRAITKIISSVLCAAITLQVGLALTVERVNAAGGVISVSGTEVDIKLSSPKNYYTYWFYIQDSDDLGKGKYKIYNRDPDTDQSDAYLQDISLVRIYGDNGNAGLVIETDVEATILSQGSNSSVSIFEDCTLTTNSFSGLGPGYSFENRGTIKVQNFKATDFKDFHSADFMGYSILEADTVDLTGNDDSVDFYSSAKIYVEKSFTNDSDSLYCTVYAKPNTTIKNPTGGKFTLQVDYADGTSAKKQITEVTESTTAAALMDDPKVTLANVPSTIYVGENIESILTSCIKYGNYSYSGTPYLEYRESGDVEYSTTVPTTPNRNYNVRVVAPASDSYGRTESDYVTFTYDYYPLGSVSSSDEYFTLEGVDESGKYIIEDPLTITPAEGFKISCSSGDNPNTYLDQLELSEEQASYSGGQINGNMIFSFQKSDSPHAGARTKDIFASSIPSLRDLVFETEAPDIYGLSPALDMGTPIIAGDVNDGVVAELDNPTITLSDGAVIKEEELTVVIEDRTLNSVTVDGTTYDRSDFFHDSNSETYFFSPDPYTSTPGKSQIVSVSATDEFNRTTSLSFTLKSPELGNVTAAVSVPATIYAGDSYEPTVTVTGTDEQYVAYLYYDGEEELQPTDAGEHTVFASVYFEEYDESVETEAITYTIIKRTPAITITVPDEIYAGEEYEIKAASDSDSEVSIRYIVGETLSDESTAEAPKASGKYTVLCSVAETDLYKSATKTATITILPKTVSATVTVEDITYGGTVNPVLADVPDDYDGTIVYEYKLGTAPDTSYSTTVPQAAGTYDIRVTFPETDYYSESTCSGSFTINSIGFEPEVTVADIYVGGTVTPVLEGVPEDYDGTPSYQYKLSTDTEYSSVVPESAGTYTLSVTFPETAKYSSASCSDTFTISKNDVTATVFVDNLYVGDTISPEITITPGDYNGTITYQYKPGTAEDSEYTTTAPKAAGVYTVLAILDPSDKYSGTSCTATFTISKVELDPTLTVADIKVGQTPAPSVTGVPEDYDGEITFAYIDGNGNSFSGESLAAGNYLVRATIPETDKFESAVCETDLEVSKNDLSEAKVTVESIKVGQTPAPSVTGVPEDYDGEITFAYIDGNGNSFSGEPLAAGSYLVRATIPETDKYERAVCETDLVVSKYEITAAVSVADIAVGGTVDPVLTVDPDAYDGEAVFEYMGSTDIAYSSEVPSAAGTYTVKVTLPETDAFLGTTCTDTFTIGKKEVTAAVSVEDIYVGDTVKPVLTVDPSDYDGKAEYEYKPDVAPASAYSSEVPSAAGTYSVRVTLPETDAFFGTTCTDTFTIEKKEFEASVSVADILVGGTVTPVLSGVPEDYDGAISYQYKSGSDSAYSSTVPSAAGTYTVLATLPATDKYVGTTCTDTFTIGKIEFEASVSVADILVGGTVTPVLSGVPEDYDGVITFEYKGSTDAAFSKTVPTAAGTYTIRATLPETAKFLGTTCTGTFTISKNEVAATVSVADVYVGETPKPVVTTDPKDYDGEISFEYKESSEADTAYSSAVPSKAGKYTVRAALSSTANYLGTSCEASFAIKKKATTASVYVADTFVGKTPNPVVTTNSDGKATFEYKPSGSADSAYTSTAPTAKGTYTCKATIAETDNYLGITCTCEFKIRLNPVEVLELSVSDTFYGLTVSSSVNTDSDGTVSVMYKPSGAADSAYSAAAPTKVGDYTAMATVAETSVFESKSVTTNFKITYLDAPGTAYIPSGTEGKNGYFISDVTLKAPGGFSISTTEGSGYSASVPYTESLSTIYLKRDDGALTAGISINKPKIDKVAPVISSSSGVMYVDSLSITASDKNLMSLTVNGSPVAVSGGTASVTLRRPDRGSQTFTIVAEDEAGNINSVELTLMEEWLGDKKVPEGQAVSLVAGEVYYFNEGQWIVSIVNSDGTITEGTTVFSGNLPFYVSVSGDYIFTRVT